MKNATGTSNLLHGDRNRRIPYSSALRNPCKVRVIDDEAQLMSIQDSKGRGRSRTEVLRDVRLIKGQEGQIVDKMVVRDKSLVIVAFEFYGEIVTSILPENFIQYVS